MTTQGIGHVLSVAGRWVVACALLPEESSCKLCELTQQQLFMCVCVTVWNMVGAFVCLSLLVATEHVQGQKEVTQS